MLVPLLEIYFHFSQWGPNDYSEKIIVKSFLKFAKITNTTCNSLKSLLFPEFLGVKNPLNMMKNNSHEQGILFAMKGRVRVRG